jgi:hypothetical protein
MEQFPSIELKDRSGIKRKIRESVRKLAKKIEGGANICIVNKFDNCLSLPEQTAGEDSASVLEVFLMQVQGWIDAATGLEIRDFGDARILELRMPFLLFFQNKLVSEVRIDISPSSLRVEVLPCANGSVVRADANYWNTRYFSEKELDEMASNFWFENNSTEHDLAAIGDLWFALGVFQTRAGVEKVYSRVLRYYNERKLEEVALTEAIVAIRTIGYADNDLVREILPQLPVVNRRVLRQKKYKELTCAELRAKAIEMDRERYRVHRALEHFAFKYLFGKSKGIVMRDLQLNLDLEINSCQRKIIWGSVHCIYDPHGSEPYKGDFRVDLGLGGHTGSSDGYEPAPRPAYESYIHRDNSLYDDQIIAENIVARLRTEIEGFQPTAICAEEGSTHERWINSEITFGLKELRAISKKQSIGVPELLEKIYLIIREELEDSNKIDIAN